MQDLTAAALAYLRLGFHLLALTGKRPNTRYHEEWSWDNSIHGTPETPEDDEALRQVFTHPSTTGVAILVPEHVLVADIDSDKAAAIFAESVPTIEPTVIAKTAKGFHVWYVAPGADGSVWVGGRDGLLMKGFGGYVVAEPSTHPGDPATGLEPGQHYRWLLPPYEAGIDWLPAPLAERIKAQSYFDDQRAALKTDGDFYSFEYDPALPGPLHLIKRVALDGLCKAIINAPDGNQNNVIAWAALVAQEEGVPYSVAMDVLLAAAVEGGHPERRARTTITGAYKRRRSR